MTTQRFVRDYATDAWRPIEQTPSWAKRVGLALIAAPVVMAASLIGGGTAHADVMLTDLYTVDGVDYPECSTEDCSDVPYGVGVWEDKDTGNWYFTTPEFSTLIVDDTVD